MFCVILTTSYYFGKLSDNNVQIVDKQSFSSIFFCLSVLYFSLFSPSVFNLSFLLCLVFNQSSNCDTIKNWIRKGVGRKARQCWLGSGGGEFLPFCLSCVLGANGFASQPAKFRLTHNPEDPGWASGGREAEFDLKPLISRTRVKLWLEEKKGLKQIEKQTADD